MGDLLGLEYSLALELELENKKLRERLERLEEKVFGVVRDEDEITTICNRDCVRCGMTTCMLLLDFNTTT